MFSVQEHTDKFGDNFPIKRRNVWTKGRIWPSLDPRDNAAPRCDGNGAVQAMRKSHPWGFQSFHLFHSWKNLYLVTPSRGNLKSEKRSLINWALPFCSPWLQCGSRELEILGIIINQRNSSPRPLVWRECHSFGTLGWFYAWHVLSPLHGVAGSENQSRVYPDKKELLQEGILCIFLFFIFFFFFGRWAFQTGIYRFILMYKKGRLCKN